MKLTAGQPAPSFQSEDIFGESIDLSTYKGKPVLLSFFRNGACAICNLQVHKLIKNYPTYHAQGLEVIAVFESPLESVRQNVGKQDAPFRILADPQARIYDLYGVETDKDKVMSNINTPMQTILVKEASAIGYKLTHEEGSNFFRLPADFLIGPDQTIHTTFYSEIVGEHLPFTAIEQFLETIPARG